MEEYIDILDEHGVCTGNTCTKDHAHRYGYFHASVHVWFYTSDGQLLIQKRASDKNTFPGLWDISVAGHVSAGESYEVAAYRECLEEIGVTIDPEKLLKIGVQKKQYQFSPTFTDSEFNHIYIYQLPVPFGELRMQEEEVEDLALISLENFKKEITNKATFTKYVPHPIPYYMNVIKVVSETLLS